MAFSTLVCYEKFERIETSQFRFQVVVLIVNDILRKHRNCLFVSVSAESLGQTFDELFVDVTGQIDQYHFSCPDITVQ